LSRKVRAYAHPEARGEKRTFASVDIKLIDGRILHATQDYPQGSPSNPATPEEIYRKFKTLAGAVLSEHQTGELVAAIESVEKFDDIAKFIPILLSRA
jgi:hypothetical protein